MLEAARIALATRSMLAFEAGKPWTGKLWWLAYRATGGR